MADEWSERIASHPVMSGLDELSTVLEQAPVVNPNASTKSRSYLDRAQAVVSNFRARLDSTHAALVPIPVLDRAVTHLRNAQSQIQAFLSDNDENHLATADGHIDSLLMEVHSLPPPVSVPEAEVQVKALRDDVEHLRHIRAGVVGAFGALRQQMEAESERFAESARASEERIDNAAKGLEERLAALAQTADKRAADITAQSEAKIAELRAAIDSQKGRLDEAIAQTQKTFGEAQERRLGQFTESEKERETLFLQRTDALLEGGRDKLAALLSEAEALVAELKAHEARAAQVVGVAAASEVAGAYIDEAKQQCREADRLRLAAFAVVGVFMIYALILALLGPPGGDVSATDWLRYAVVRGPIGFVLAAPFPYAVRQSARHRQREEQAKHLALQLSAFRPFLSELGEEERRREIIEASKRMFPGHQSQRSPGDSGD